MPRKIIRLWICLLVLFGTIILGCSKETPTSTISVVPQILPGTWSTNGIYVDINTTEGVDMTFNISASTMINTAQDYRRDSLTGQWSATSYYCDTFSYVLDHTFIKWALSEGSTGAWHYSIENNKLTINSTADHGGIYQGSSGSLTGQAWTYEYKWYDEYDSFLATCRDIKYYHADGTGYEIRSNDRPPSGWCDTTAFTYAISGNELIHYFSVTYSYVAIYEIYNNKLYLYGKPKTSDNDDYYSLVLYKQ